MKRAQSDLEDRQLVIKEKYLIAIDRFQRAIDIEPNYALAYSGLADTLRFSVFFNVSLQKN